MLLTARHLLERQEAAVEAAHMPAQAGSVEGVVAVPEEQIPIVRAPQALPGR